MKHQSTENLNPTEAKEADKNAAPVPEIRVIVESSDKKPVTPKWWDVLGWILRLVIALATLLKFLKDRN